MFQTIFFCIIHFPCDYVIFIKNQNQFVAQFSFLFVVISPTCIGHIYWPSSAIYHLRIISSGYSCCCVYNY